MSEPEQPEQPEPPQADVALVEPVESEARLQGGGGLLRVAIRRPVTVLCVVLLLALFGVLSTLRLPIQLAPDIAIPTLTITTDWPGAAPTEVEMEILEEQEDVLKSIPGLETMKSEARADQAQITLEFEVGTSLEESLVRVSNRLSQVPRYPDAAREPVIATSNNAGPPLAVITIRARDASNVDAYRTWADKQILPQLERIRGVSGIRLIGGREQELHVDFDPVALAARGLTPATVAQRVQGELRDISGGDFVLGKRRLLLRTPIAPDVPEELERAVLGSNADGTPILLGDVADVSIGLRKRTAMAMSDDRPSLVLLLWREAGTNVLEVTEALKAKVRELDEQRFAPEGLEFELISDQTGYINGALELVRQNLILGGALAIVVLLLFLRSLGASLLIGVTIPVCVVGTMLGMSLLGRTVNVVSLAGMAFAVGMVVDNAIVVLESIDAWRGRVQDAARAAFEGVREVWGAILASTVTTAIVFVPVISWQDEVGELLRDVAVAISMAVGFSLLVSVFAIPSFAARVLGTHAPTRTDRLTRAGAGVRRMIGAQVAFLSRRWARALLVVGLGVAVTGWLALRYLPPMEYLPTGNRNLVFGILVPPPGYSVEEMARIGEEVQREVSNHTGRDVDGVPSIARSFYVGDPNRVFMGAVAEQPERIGEVLQFYRATEAKIPGMFAVASQASLFGRSIGGGRSVEVEVSGTDLGAIVGFGGRLLGAIREAIPGAQIRPIPSLDLGAPEVHAVPRRDEVAALGVGGAELGLAVDALVDGAIIGEYGREGEPKIDVALRARGRDGQLLDTPTALANAPVATPSGALVPMSRLVRLEEVPGPTVIQRIERRRAITLQVSPPEALALEDAMRRIREDVLAGLRAQDAIPDGIDITLSGTAGQLEGAKARFAEVLLLALIISYLVLAALFEDFLAPIAVLVTVPLAAAGGVLGLRLVDSTLGPQSLDMMTAMGFLILLGVVVNNAILVVDGALARLRRGELLPAAVRGAVEGRVRPIFMSSLTSLAGLLPLVLFPGSGSELYRGVGSVVLGGLALSTALTLYLTPCLFTVLWRARGVR